MEYLAHVLGCEETAELTLLGLGGHTTQEAAEDDGEDDVRHGPCPLLVVPREKASRGQQTGTTNWNHKGPGWRG